MMIKFYIRKATVKNHENKNFSKDEHGNLSEINNFFMCKCGNKTFGIFFNNFFAIIWKYPILGVEILFLSQ